MKRLAARAGCSVLESFRRIAGATDYCTVFSITAEPSEHPFSRSQNGSRRGGADRACAVKGNAGREGGRGSRLSSLAFLRYQNKRARRVICANLICMPFPPLAFSCASILQFVSPHFSKLHVIRLQPQFVRELAITVLSEEV